MNKEMNKDMNILNKKLKALPITTNPLITKADLQEAFHQLCMPLVPYYSEGKAHLNLGATASGCSGETAAMEGFSRVLWGLVPLAAGGGQSPLWELYREGIINGTNPQHEEYWGNVNHYDQKLVEMAAIGFALAIAPEHIWEPLTSEQKERFYQWLNQMNEKSLYDCNWLFFLVMVNLGFKRLGLPYREDLIQRNLQEIDKYYVEDGWYSDGLGGHCDYYGPFAIHYYSLLYAAWVGDEDEARCTLYKQRAVQFAKQFLYWFADDGSALPYGRSLTYRFSQAAFWSALVYAEVDELPYGLCKGILLRHLRWWFQQPMFASDGTLSIGYSYPNLIMAENYNAPGSPYWALKAFLVLALPDDHPFWLAEELPLPQLAQSNVQQAPHLVMWRAEQGNHILAFNTGHPASNDHTHTAAKYEKFVYSNKFGFSVARAEWGLAQGAFDSMLALSEGDHLYRGKRFVKQSRIDGNVLSFVWEPWRDVSIITWLIAGSPWHIRAHRIESQRTLHAADGGFAIGIEGEKGHNVVESNTQQQSAVVATPWGASGIISLYGEGKPSILYPNANTNIIHARTAMPTVQLKLEPGVHWLVTGVYGYGTDDEGKLDDWGKPPYVVFREGDGKLEIYNGEGEHLLELDLQ